MGKKGIGLAIFGLASNFTLFLIKLYVFVSTSSLAIYCDGINNLGDTASCVIALLGFVLVARLDDRRGSRAQALATFMISLIIMVAGVYFAYQGLERIMYPLPIQYSTKYAVLVFATIIAKLGMAFIYYSFNKAGDSRVIKALMLDSFLDVGVTSCALAGLLLANKIGLAVDGIASIIIGVIVAVCSARELIDQSKYLINS